MYMKHVQTTTSMASYASKNNSRLSFSDENLSKIEGMEQLKGNVASARELPSSNHLLSIELQGPHYVCKRSTSGGGVILK